MTTTAEKTAPDAPRRAEGVVALGASAGGFTSLETILKALPKDFPWPVLVAQHLDPKQPSHAAEVLARASALPVVEAAAGMRLEPGRVYACPANSEMAISKEGVVRLRAPVAGRPQRIDFLFDSLARSYEECGVAVVLSGTGSDGASGALHLKRVSGTVIAESEETARHFGMPNAAIQAGAVDLVLPAQDIPDVLVRIATGQMPVPAQEERGAMDRILTLLRERRGTTFEQYRAGTLTRRMRKRMPIVGATTLAGYLQHIEGNPAELDSLFDALLINVTEFFRDPDAWDALQRTIVPELKARMEENDELRVWSVGCASGEEPYSIAMLLAESLDPAQWSRVKIFATDADEPALNEARAARYDPARMSHVSPQRLSRFFTPVGARYEIVKSIRQMVIFGRHDLTKDPPIGRLDLVVCRNVLIYFDVPLQRRIASTLQYSLRPGGFLFLGKSEEVPREVPGYDVRERQSRIYQRQLAIEPMLPRIVRAPSDQMLLDAETRSTLVGSGAMAFQEFLAERAPLVVLVVDKEMRIRKANRFARGLLGIGDEEIVGRDLVSVLRARGESLASAVEAALSGGRRVHVDPVRCDVSGRSVVLDVTLEAFADADGATQALLVGQDVTATEDAREALRDRARQLQDTLEEYQTTNEELQSSNEELVTANEELQSANEELTTLNEELQSTNEELETTNEELHATNEELGAVNAQISRASGDAADARAILAATTDHVSDAVLLVSPDERIATWSRRAADLFGQAAAEVVGANVYSVDLPVDPVELRALLSESKKKSFAHSDEARLLEERGRRRWVKLGAWHVEDNDRNALGWLLVFEDVTGPHEADVSLRAMQAQHVALLRATREAVLVLGPDGVVVAASDAAKTVLGEDPVRGRVWDLAKDPSVKLHIKGAIADLTGHEARPAKETTHSIHVPLARGGSVEMVVIGVESPEAGPLIVLRLVDAAQGGEPRTRP